MRFLCHLVCAAYAREPVIYRENICTPRINIAVLICIWNSHTRSWIILKTMKFIQIQRINGICFLLDLQIHIFFIGCRRMHDENQWPVNRSPFQFKSFTTCIQEKPSEYMNGAYTHKSVLSTIPAAEWNVANFLYINRQDDMKTILSTKWHK